ncbi:HWE histidine kinase domain-containing protein [Sulfitobacter aestuarii]|uniref:histidine kinase n=1 Tax=Sulfitobacter aestuarii TaxID=2161676 RepID=A0ABW5U2A0_9RHOB
MNTSFPNHRASHLDLIAATSDIGLWELDVRTGVAERNLRHDQIFGYVGALDRWSDEIFLSHVVARDRERVGGLLRAAVAAGEPWAFETEILSAQGDRRWISAKGQPRFDGSGKITHLIGHVLDITASKRREERLKLLSGELNHRVLNTISVIRAMVRISAHNAGNIEDFTVDLDARLDALARSSRMLTRNPDKDTFLREIVETEVAMFGSGTTRIGVTGPTDISLEPRSAEAMTLVLHELLTNAAKHGALSNDDGRIDIAITRNPDNSLSLNWEESGGPEVGTPGPAGFGGALIANALNGVGDLQRDYRREGLRVKISLPYQRPVHVLPRPSDNISDAPRLLLVEDEVVIGMDLSLTLEEAGFSVDGPHADVAAAMRALNVMPDIALLDVQLGKETSAPVAERLRALGVPFVVLSGRASDDPLPPGFEGAAVMQKPHRDCALLALLQQCLDAAAEDRRGSGT